MANQRIKTFWINKIDTALTTYSVDPSTLGEGVDWKDKLNAMTKWKELDSYGKTVFRDVFTKANQAIPNPLLPNSDNYGTILGNSYEDLENEYADLVNVMKTQIGVDPTDGTLATDNNGNNIVVNGNPVPKWKQIIKQKLPNNYTKLTDIPAGYDLADILYARKLYLEIVDNATGLNDIIERNLTGGDVVVEYGFDFMHKVNKTRLQEYKDAAKTITDAENYLQLGGKRLVDVMNGGNPGNSFANIPATPAHADYLELPTSLEDLVYWYKENDKLFHIRAKNIDIFDRSPVDNKVISFNLDKIEDYAESLNRLGLTDFQATTIANKLGTSKLSDIPAGKTLTDLITATPTCPLTHCPPTHTNYNTIKSESDHYRRIHTKLNGKVSDTELQTLLDASPSCSHSDYDTIKSERDTLKTENTQLKEHQCDCASKVAEKETQIITKIITDLQLSTERERENVLDAVITEIKTKLAPPADNSADKQKITELETKITNLQAPKSLNDLPISQEVKKEVIKISQDLGLTAQSCAKLEKASSYQELSNLQKEAFQEKLNSEISNKKSAETLNYCLGALTIGSLLVLFWMLIKQTKTNLPKIGEGK